MLSTPVVVAMPAPIRRCGVLLHPTSLPGRFAIGDLGPAAEAFVERLASAGQGVWQMLPLGPTGAGDSPYGTLSAFAGNPLLVSPERLNEDGLLTTSELAEATLPGRSRIDHGAAHQLKPRLLRRAFDRLDEGAAPHLREEAEAWAGAPEQAAWLPEWALYAALREREGQRPWSAWPGPLRHRDSAALDAARRELARELRFQAFVQFAFDRQFRSLRETARRWGVAIFGDLPLYLATDSADLWSRRELFELDEDGRPLKVAGVPPDYFSADGQLWGNPLYRWDRVAADGYRWWIERLRANLRRFDFVRLDHFRGFVGYWELPGDATTARDGRWVEGPGRRLFEALRAALGDLQLVAEDLGVITDEVNALRDELGLPGMRVLQFGFGADAAVHLPHRFSGRTVAYTGTHDNDTTRGWFATLDAPTRRRVLDYLGCEPREVPRALMRAVYASTAELAVVPMQDLLGLGSAARMNRPGVASGNWAWRLRAGAFGGELAEVLRRLAEVTERLPSVPAS
jgi:4-alpha-glucanotransferase